MPFSAICRLYSGKWRELQAAQPYTPSARFRSSNFCTFPVEVFGNSPNTTWRGHLKRARCSRQNAINSSPVAAFQPGSAPDRSLPAITFYLTSVDPDTSSMETDND